MKQLKQETIRYMRGVWGFDTAEEFDDIALFWSRGEYELVAKRLVQGGAVEPNCNEAKNIIEVAESISFEKEKEIIDEVLADNVTTVDCPHCNYVHFIDLQSYDADIIDSCQGCLKPIN